MPTSGRETAQGPPALRIDSLSAGYGRTPVLQNVSVTVSHGEFVAILGANGVGKSTLLRAIIGAATITSGSIHISGTDTTRRATHRMNRCGVAVVPEGRQLVADLSVVDNLLLGTLSWNRRMNSRLVREQIAETLERFPILGQRKRQLAGSLSGGQQQLLAIARSLIARPALLLLDEPSLGLAPKTVHEVFDYLRVAHTQGLTIVLAEQNSAAALRVADRGYVLSEGRIVREASASQLVVDGGLSAVIFGRNAANDADPSNPELQQQVTSMTTEGETK